MACLFQEVEVTAALPTSRGLQLKNYNQISSELIYYASSFQKENGGISTAMGLAMTCEECWDQEEMRAGLQTPYLAWYTSA